MLTEIIFYILIFIFGTIVGSFLNVLILRYNTGIPFWKGRSFCFSCGKKLSSLELIPLFSFLFQGGKCRGCQSKISWQYPTVEALTGLLFVGIFVKYGGLLGLSPNLYFIILSMIVISTLLTIAVYDMHHKIIPDGLVITFSILSILKIVADFYLLDLSSPEIKLHTISFLIAGPALAFPLFLLWLFSKGQWMGLGDPKLVLGIGWFLGPIYGLSAVILAFWTGAVYGLILLILSKFSWHGLKINGRTEVPFAPFLILGFILVFFFQIDILNLGFLIP